MNFIILALQSADTFPQAVACAPRRCGGGKVSAGWGGIRCLGGAALSVRVRLFRRLGVAIWPCKCVFGGGIYTRLLLLRVTFYSNSFVFRARYNGIFVIYPSFL